MKKYIALLALTGLTSMSIAHAEGDIDNGLALSSSCLQCHDSDGKGTIDRYPNIGRQKESYLVKQLESFKSGVRTDPIMDAIVGPLSSQDIEDLAAYYSSVGPDSSSSTFSASTGILNIPSVIVDNVSYGLQLQLTDPDAFTFTLDFNSISVN